jgi:hypothetical protein
METVLHRKIKFAVGEAAVFPHFVAGSASVGRSIGCACGTSRGGQAAFAADFPVSRKGHLKGGQQARMPALRRRGAEKRRKGDFCGAGLEAIVGFSVVVDYVEAWEWARPVVGCLGWGLAVFQMEERGGGVARRVEFGEGKDKRARIFDH